jgi:hypothetical protein
MSQGRLGGWARRAGALSLIAALAAACAQTGTPTSAPAGTVTPPTGDSPSEAPTAALSPVGGSPAASASGADGAATVWLCMPGARGNPCEATLTTTVIDAAGNRSVKTLAPAQDPPIDCFYVYPTTSRQPTSNADLSVDPELVTIATWQAAPFSSVCRVYAPVYPQLTIAALDSRSVTTDQMMVAYAGVASAFADYLANFNHGRGVVLIGHSQGAMHLISLLGDQFDTRPEVRSLLVSALLLGGNATTARGSATRGDFLEIPTCASATQTGCVVGYSSFGGTPPATAIFGRPETAAGLLRRPQPGEQIMCVNPAAIGGAGVFREPLIPASDLPRLTIHPPASVPTTTFVTYPDAYSAECKASGSAAWLEVTRLPGAKAAPVLTGTEGPDWGMHDLDVSLPLGNLLDLVAAQSATYRF